MLILVLMAIIRTAGTLISVIFHAAMPLVIMCVGIAILCSCVGVKLNFGFVGAITTALANGLGYLGRMAISAIGWVFRHFIMLIPACYESVKKFFESLGMSSLFAKLLAGLVTVLLFVVLI